MKNKISDNLDMNMRERVTVARKHMGVIFGDAAHADYFLLDTAVAERYGISTPTVRKIRRDIGVGPRDQRILEAVNKYGPSRMSIDDMLTAIGPRGVTYHGLYMLLRARGVAFMRKNKG
jgi:hypothetical protein